MLVIGLLVTILGGGLVWRLFTADLRKSTVKKLGPGLTLTSTTVTLPGDIILKTHVVRVDRKNWKLHLAPGAPTVSGKSTVSEIVAAYDQAHTRPAPIGINGGFFAYNGAAVDTVKIDGEWIRLPWKNRTAIGWGATGAPRIDNLKGKAIFKVGEAAPLKVDNLNGRPTATTLTVLRKWFGKEYQLSPGETAVTVENGTITRKSTSGKVVVPLAGFVVVAGKERADLNAFKLAQPASFNVETVPADWDKFPTILGAGPRLIRDGHVAVTQVEEEFKSDVTTRGPRTAIGIDEKGDLIIMVVEGWHFVAKGITLGQLAVEMQKLGVVDAINLDGGYSTTLIAEGQLINNMSRPREVPVANAVLVVPREKN